MAFLDSVLSLIVRTSTDLPPDVRSAMQIAMAQETPQTQSSQALSIIAQKFNTSMAAIQLLNNIDDARLVRAGQRLKIPTTKLAPDENTFWILYVVQPNETFSAIALRFGVQLNDLLRVNNITNPALVRAGQRLIIPLRAPA